MGNRREGIGGELFILERRIMLWEGRCTCTALFLGELVLGLVWILFLMHMLIVYATTTVCRYLACAVGVERAWLGRVMGDGMLDATLMGG